MALLENKCTFQKQTKNLHTYIQLAAHWLVQTPSVLILSGFRPTFIINKNRLHLIS